MSYMHLYLTYFQHSLVGIVGFTGSIPQLTATGQFPVSGFASQAAMSSPTRVSADTPVFLVLLLAVECCITACLCMGNLTR